MAESTHNIWERALGKLARDHRKDGLTMEANHLEAAVKSRKVINEQTWCAVVAAICWWDDTMLEKAADEIRP